MTDYSTYREKVRLPQPPLLLQGNTAKCWAYALASWQMVSSGGEYRDPEALITKWNDLLGIEGAVRPDQAQTVLLQEGAVSARSISPSDFTAAFLVQLLDYHYVFMASQKAGTAYAHCVVIYGVRGASSAKVAYFDPQLGYRVKSLPFPTHYKILIAY